MIEPIRASSLRLMILDEWPETSTKTKGIPVSKAGNFVAVDIDKLTCGFPISASSLETHYKQVISSVDKSFDKKVRLEVLTCVRNVCENLILLDDKLENESAVRLAIGNPVVKMLCTIQGLFICVEEQLSPPNESRRSSLQSADGVTEKSSADYVCYTLYEHDSKLKLAAVVIEVKTDDVHVPSAVAQLMGYYLRSCTARDGHTIGLLLTPTQIHIFLFPFSKGRGKGIVGCVNAIWLQQLSYSTDDIVTTMGVLCVLAVVTRKDFQIALSLDEIFWPISKDYTFMIETEIEMMKKELEDLIIFFL